MEDKEFDSLNVVPFIDIMLVLLTIVLVTASFIASGAIPVSLPTAKGQAQLQQKEIRLVIRKDGTIFYENTQVNLVDLERLLSPLERNLQISVFADRDARVQRLVDVLDLLKRLGFQKVHIRTQES